MSQLNTRLLGEIDGLGNLERAELLNLWIKAFGAPPFKGARNTTLTRGIAYHLQSKTIGALKPSVSRALLKTAADGVVKTTAPSTSKGPSTKLGTQLVREWNGKTHTVHVTDKGCVMSGVTYSSLSAVAKAITGTHWSGPRFFGVTS